MRPRPQSPAYCPPELPLKTADAAGRPTLYTIFAAILPPNPRKPWVTGSPVWRTRAAGFSYGGGFWNNLEQLKQALSRLQNGCSRVNCSRSPTGSPSWGHKRRRQWSRRHVRRLVARVVPEPRVAQVAPLRADDCPLVRP